MALNTLVYLLVIGIACSFQYVKSDGAVPAFLWGNLEFASRKSNPLIQVSENDFHSILKEEQANNPFVVVFVEETLSVEDFSLKNSLGETAFPYLHANIDDSLYLPSVEGPLHSLQQLVDPKTLEYVKLPETDLSAERSEKFLLINLKDAKEGESRIDMLRRHNDLMLDMFTKLHERFDKVIGVYTASNPSWTVSHSRQRRQAENNPFHKSDNLLFYIRGMVLRQGTRVVQLDNPAVTSAVVDEFNMTATATFAAATVTLYFSKWNGYWLARRIEVAEGSSVEELENDQVYALSNASYRCSDGVIFSSPTKDYSLTLRDMQVQPFSGDLTTFGDTIYYCVGFTSAPIWACLFVVFILLAIMFYGVAFMMDIRTMDRFDDPKGKTISFNTLE